MRSWRSKLVAICLTIGSVCCAADASDNARQGFTVIVPPKASFAHQQTDLMRQVTVSATVDMWVQCDTVAKANSVRDESVSWGRKILCQQPTTVRFAEPANNSITVITFAAF